MRAWVVATLFAMALATPAWAVEPSERLADPALEARARSISAALRCLVCQNESIDASNADLAHDIRVLVRQRLVAGDDDDQVIAFMVARYGDFVLLRPPLRASTLLLWLGPAAILVIGGGGAYAASRRRRSAAPLDPAPLSHAERRALEELDRTGS